MALNLQVPGIQPLQVGYNGATAEIMGFGGPHVQPDGPDGNDVLVIDFFDEEINKVSDVSRYLIGAEDCCLRHNNRYRICNDRYLIPHCDVSEQALEEQQLLQQHIGNIVLLLESPHKDEYQPGNINCPIAPANGKTGDNIDRCLSTVLRRINAELIEEELIEEELIVPDCNVIISNPIQFQTSLHAIHGQGISSASRWKTLRDHVWRTLWDEEHIKQCFRDRLDTYNPSLIVNACTSDLKPLVTSCVEEWINGREPGYPVVLLYRADPHPSIWNNCNDIVLGRISPPPNQNAGNP